ncbi:MAG: acyltransferase domain-containing protein [Desulfobacteraceae bacterium]|nr:acyltransferase domain-containing protein [Desulfobacteraceae bacterium]
MRNLTDMLGQKQVFSKILNIGVPLHTPMIAPHKETLYQGIYDIRTMPPTIPMYSSLFGRLGKNGDYNARYWTDQIREPVMFGAGIEAMRKDGYQFFLEISPNTVLMGLIDEVYKYAGDTKCTVIPTLERRKDEKTAALTSIAHLCTFGISCPTGTFQV